MFSQTGADAFVVLFAVTGESGTSPVSGCAVSKLEIVSVPSPFSAPNAVVSVIVAALV